MSTLTLEFEVITPVFCAGADQNGPAEIRPFSIRGDLRWFYRALDAGFRSNEGRFFGSTAGGQGQASPVTLFVEPPADLRWPSASYADLLDPKAAMSKGECYLGYTFYLGGNRRQGVKPGTTFKVILSPTWAVPTKQVLQAWSASMWLFANLGGLGSRARRGFGSLRLLRWEAEGDWPRLPVIDAKDVADWHKQFDNGYGTIRRWFNPVLADTGHQVLPVKLYPVVSQNGFSTWFEALRDIGEHFRNFRYPSKGPKPPKHQVASFGLPLASRTMQDILVPASSGNTAISDRSASRLWIRVVRIGDRYHPMVWTCDGPLLPPGHSDMVWKKSKQREMARPGLGLIPQFLHVLKAAGYV